MLAEPGRSGKPTSPTPLLVAATAAFAGSLARPTP
jgi:hypothetical protein